MNAHAQRLRRAFGSPRTALLGALLAPTLGLGLASSAPHAAATTAPDDVRTIEHAPFAVANGFTHLALGDAALGDAEVTGSLATLGSLNLAGAASLKPFNVDDALPQVDGSATSLLTQRVRGTGSLRVDGAAVRVSTTDNVTMTAEQGWTRLTTDAGGALDVTAQPAPSDLNDFNTVTAKLAAAAYFSNTAGQITATNSCLNSLASSPAVNRVRLAPAPSAPSPSSAAPSSASPTSAPPSTAPSTSPSAAPSSPVSATPSGAPSSQPASSATATPTESQAPATAASPLASDRPNVILGSELAGRRLTFTDPDYRPSAAAPLVIRVESAADLPPLDLWPDGDPAAAFTLFDLSTLSGALRIDNAVTGALWAPEVDLSLHAAPITGQLLAGSWNALEGSAVHARPFKSALPCDAMSLHGEVSVPSSDAKQLAQQGGKVRYVAQAEHLTPGSTCRLRSEVSTLRGKLIGVSAVSDVLAAQTRERVAVELRVPAAVARQQSGRTLAIAATLSCAEDVSARDDDVSAERLQFSIAAPATVPANDQPGETSTAPAAPLAPHDATGPQPSESEDESSGTPIPTVALAVAALIAAGIMLALQRAHSGSS